MEITKKGWERKVAQGLFAVVLLLGSLYLIALAATSYRVNNGTSVNIGEQGYCKVVVNNSGYDIFVPTNTAGEYSAFITYAPAGVSLYDTKSDFSSTCCWSGSYYIYPGWPTRADCESHNPALCDRNAAGCWDAD